jgi:hypothetical protein
VQPEGTPRNLPSANASPNGRPRSRSIDSDSARHWEGFQPGTAPTTGRRMVRHLSADEFTVTGGVARYGRPRP